MKDRIVFFVVAVVLASIAVFCYTQLEIGETTRWARPSREARQNPYLALERWLAGRGLPVRAAARGGIGTVLAGPEKTVFIETSAFDWYDYDSGSSFDENYENDEDEENASASRLTAWIKNGGRLIISIDMNTMGWRLSKYLAGLGVEEYQEEDEYDEWDEEKETVESGGADNSGADNNDTGAYETVEYDSLPELDQGKRFILTEKAGGAGKVSVINGIRYIYPDKARILPDKIVFVYLEMGKGSVAVMGEAYFLRYESLREAPSADLAGALFPAGTGEGAAGVLFIRSGGNEKHLFGNLAERGNPVPLLAAVIVLLVTGFWMTIPLFGRVKAVPALPGKPLRERFLAEGRFLFKYNALDKYLAVYESELEHAAGQTAAEDSDHHHKNSKNNDHSLRYFMKRQLHYSEELERVKSGARQTNPQEKT